MGHFESGDHEGCLPRGQLLQATAERDPVESAEVLRWQWKSSVRVELEHGRREDEEGACAGRELKADERRGEAEVRCSFGTVNAREN